MKCIIASNRQLPIRYYKNEQCYIKRGSRCPQEIELPFFVEVDLLGDHTIIAEYIEEIKKQYIQCNIQIYSKEASLLEWLSKQHTVTIKGSRLIVIE